MLDDLYSMSIGFFDMLNIVEVPNIENEQIRQAVEDWLIDAETADEDKLRGKNRNLLLVRI